MKEKGFDIIISSDAEYNELCAEIYFNKQFFGILTQENGIENSIIEIDLPKNMQTWVFNYLEFIEILKDAKDSLERMKKIEP